MCFYHPSHPPERSAAPKDYWLTLAAGLQVMGFAMLAMDTTSSAAEARARGKGRGSGAEGRAVEGEELFDSRSSELSEDVAQGGRRRVLRMLFFPHLRLLLHHLAA